MDVNYQSDLLGTSRQKYLEQYVQISHLLIFSALFTFFK